MPTRKPSARRKPVASPRAASAATPKVRKGKAGRPSHGPHMKRKNIYVDQRKLDEAKAFLGVATETEAIDAALARLTFARRFVEGLRELATVGGFDYPFEDDRPSERDLKWS